MSERDRVGLCRSVLLGSHHLGNIGYGTLNHALNVAQLFFLTKSEKRYDTNSALRGAGAEPERLATRAWGMSGPVRIQEQNRHKQYRQTIMRRIDSSGLETGWRSSPPTTTTVRSSPNGAAPANVSAIQK